MIDVINLKKSFGSVEVLKGINMTINKGDIVAIIGPSGSGKSTFLRCLNCMEDIGTDHLQRGGYCRYEGRYQYPPKKDGHGIPALQSFQQQNRS